MARTPRDRVAALIKDVETRARRLRADVDKAVSTTGLRRKLKVGVGKFRKQAAAAVKELEKHVHQLGKDLEAAGRKKSPSRARAKRRRVRSK